MNASEQVIPLINLALSFIPVVAVLGILYQWSLDYRNASYAVLRMLIQLLLIGYFLTYLIGTENSWVVLAVLTIMVLISSWIALGTVSTLRFTLYRKAVVSLLVGGGMVLFIISQGVLEVQPWYAPRYMIPLGGMVFANAMNNISLAAERVIAEIERKRPYQEARNIAFRASMIPTLNSLFAVGLVSLPGMMTGQILSGVSPLIAARYQIMVMSMIFGAGGIATAGFLLLIRSDMEKLLLKT